MIPIGDPDIRRNTFPIVNVALITINVLVFLYMLQLSDVDQFIFTLRHGLIPTEFTGGEPLTLELVGVLTASGPRSIVIDVASPFGNLVTLLTSMFLHGGFVHIISNMLFLWVFGDNIEDRLGHLKSLLFYLGVGLAATFAQITIDSDSQIPIVGASGAIAGILGAYLLAYPFSRINILIIFILIVPTRIPALYVLGIWFIIQLFNGWGTLEPVTASTAGVAYFAHIGGFAVGLMGMMVYKLYPREPLIPTKPPGFSWHFHQ